MSNKVKISEVLHLAANKYLAGYYAEYIYTNKNRFSCRAVCGALDELITDAEVWLAIHEEIFKGFENLGLDTESIRAFEEFEAEILTEESQGARYAWLKFCAMLYEEQGE